MDEYESLLYASRKELRALVASIEHLVNALEYEGGTQVNELRKDLRTTIATVREQLTPWYLSRIRHLLVDGYETAATLKDVVRTRPWSLLVVAGCAAVGVRISSHWRRTR